jgi:mono/diheme cytochrome c family protein
MSRNRALGIIAAVALWGAGAGLAPAAEPDVQRGRYMVLVGHCNNCHTAGYAPKQGNVPESEWLLGNPVGMRMQTGTSYASNLRLTVQSYTEDSWVKYVKTAKWRPPMPWWSMHETSEEDLRAMYRYIRHMGPAGKMMPAFVPPDRNPDPPYETRQIVK